MTFGEKCAGTIRKNDQGFIGETLILTLLCYGCHAVTHVMAFVKLDCGILDSTIWVDRSAREVFITALLMAQPREFTSPLKQFKVRSIEPQGSDIPAGWYGFAPAAGPGIVRRAGLEVEEGLAALERLCSADSESRSPDFNGMRMARVDGGYLILNFMKYRDRDYTAAERQRRLRERRRAGVTPLHNVTVTQVTQAEAEAEAEADNKPIPGVAVKYSHQLRAEALFRRRITTPLSKSESNAWKTAQAVILETDEDSWKLLEWWYALPGDKAPYRKTDFAALMNNWHAEIEKARRNKLFPQGESTKGRVSFA